MERDRRVSKLNKFVSYSQDKHTTHSHENHINTNDDIKTFLPKEIITTHNHEEEAQPSMKPISKTGTYSHSCHDLQQRHSDTATQRLSDTATQRLSDTATQ